MAYARHTAIAHAGDIGKGGLANSKTIAYRNTAQTPLMAGRFVALSEKGVQALSAKTDTVAGVVVRSVIKDEWQQEELLDVMHIGTADGIWVEVVKDVVLKRGDKVAVLCKTSGEKFAGQIQKEVGADSIATDYTVITIAGNLAEITRL
ncbi:hypothetical protein A4G19_10600 [Pasteurellaceae bacterium Macca]|nr:hypothetical protein [Pasteurellaceae bacterium Macca]MCK3656173.1 hypothetical protein [Pasteurellaceae bacterium Macca]